MGKFMKLGEDKDKSPTMLRIVKKLLTSYSWTCILDSSYPKLRVSDIRGKNLPLEQSKGACPKIQSKEKRK